MKVKEIDLSKHEYKRICIIETGKTVHLPPDTEKFFLDTYGEYTVAEDGISEKDGWLVVKADR